MDLGSLRGAKALPNGSTASVQTAQGDPLAACTLVPDRQPISCVPRRRSTVAGLVREVCLVEVDGSTSVVVVIEDEQGDSLTAVWHGRRELPRYWC